MNSRSLVVATSLCLMLTQGAALAEPGSRDQQPQRPIFAGGYVGLVGGAVWQQKNPFPGCYDFTNLDPNECSTDISFSIPGNAFNLTDTGFLGGAQIGY